MQLEASGSLPNGGVSKQAIGTLPVTQASRTVGSPPPPYKRDVADITPTVAAGTVHRSNQLTQPQLPSMAAWRGDHASVPNTRPIRVTSPLALELHTPPFARRPVFLDKHQMGQWTPIFGPPNTRGLHSVPHRPLAPKPPAQLNFSQPSKPIQANTGLLHPNRQPSKPNVRPYTSPSSRPEPQETNNRKPHQLPWPTRFTP
jgi:hypothetical protein